jgi:aspartate 4-decarboxylase
MTKTLKKKRTKKNKTLKKLTSFKQYEHIGNKHLVKKWWGPFLKHDFIKYKKLSPFELKNTLIYLAKTNHPNDDYTEFLNAGRGNPNFFNNFVRKCYSKLQSACLEVVNPLEDVPGTSTMEDLAVYPLPNKGNFKSMILKNLRGVNKREKEFIEAYLCHLQTLDKDKNKLLYDLILSMMGCFYPSPPQIQPHLNGLAKDFMYDLIFNNKKTKQKKEDYEYFATEGAAAGILYVFNTLHINGLLNHGDTIAVITPIFSPYLEMPLLKRYKLKILNLVGSPEDEWSLPDSEIEKLKDKKVKGLFMVNPANPGAYSLPKRNIDKIGEIVNSVRKDLIILSDNVYAPFVKQYNSLLDSCPENTIEVYSLSKFFGTTGWRLGIVMIRKENRLNGLIKDLSTSKQRELKDRYSITSVTPGKITLMERLVYDSRQVAEAHVGGLSTPQQAMMAMMFYYVLQDKTGDYKSYLMKLLKYRNELLYSELNTPITMTDRSTNYYTLLNVPQITENLFGKEARKKIESTDFIHYLFNLAKKYKTVLLPGIGFGAPDFYLRVSLANLATQDYKKISKNIKSCIHDFIK